jgi:hypothetical protein
MMRLLVVIIAFFVVLHYLHKRPRVSTVPRPLPPQDALQKLVDAQRDSIANESITKADVYRTFLQDYLRKDGIDETQLSHLLHRLDQLAVERHELAESRKH